MVMEYLSLRLLILSSYLELDPFSTLARPNLRRWCGVGTGPRPARRRHGEASSGLFFVSGERTGNPRPWTPGWEASTARPPSRHRPPPGAPRRLSATAAH